MRNQEVKVRRRKIYEYGDWEKRWVTGWEIGEWTGEVTGKGYCLPVRRTGLSASTLVQMSKAGQDTCILKILYLKIRILDSKSIWYFVSFIFRFSSIAYSVSSYDIPSFLPRYFHKSKLANLRLKILQYSIFPHLKQW